MLGPISEAIVELTFFVSFWVLIIHLIITWLYNKNSVYRLIINKEKNKYDW